MKYQNITEGRFLSRPNRFIANIEIGGKVEVCHIKNTGRLGELLVKGARVIVQDCQSPARKTRYDLIAVYKGDKLFNIDSQAPNKVFGEWVKTSDYFGKLKSVKAEQKFQSSRFDFLLETEERRIFVEVKGVTLEQSGVVLFPDAPTERGVKHIKELQNAVAEGFGAAICFVVKLDGAKYFTPNKKTHPEFCEALKSARESGVDILCVDCRVMPDSLEIKGFVPVKL